MEEAKSEAWKIYQSHNSSDFFNSAKLKLMALKIIIQANEAKFKLIGSGPAVLGMRSLENRLAKVVHTLRVAVQPDYMQGPNPDGPAS
jgi:hypothetical protein